MKLRIEEKQRCAVDEITQSKRVKGRPQLRTSRQLPELDACDRVEVLPLILILLLVLLSRHRLNSFQDDGIGIPM
jgi:hypothetical protein